jgi:putative hydrolase of HD superfamily
MGDAHEIMSFAYEAGQLQRIPRAGWLLAGIQHPESVAEHSFRTGVLAYVIALLEGANPDRAAALGLFHDLPETRSGDVPSVGRPYVTTTNARQIAADQTAGLPHPLAEHIRDLINEHEDAKTPAATPEARCSRDADKIDCLLKAREYQAAGNQLVQPWVDSMVNAVTTRTGKQLAAAAQELSPGAWWSEFAARFGQRSANVPPPNLAARRGSVAG